MRRIVILTVLLIVAALLIPEAMVANPTLIAEFAPGKNWNDVIVPNGADLDGTGDYVSTLDAAAHDIVGDIEVRGRHTPTDNTPGAPMVLGAKWNTVSDERSWKATLETDGKIQVEHSTDGTAGNTVTQKSTVPVGFTDGVTWWWAFVIDVSTGLMTAYWHANPNVPPAALADWDTSTTVAGSATSIYAGTALVTVGADAEGN
ncbi:hypothetical protein LCGC14_2943100, partial [marine sediment metagenome]